MLDASARSRVAGRFREDEASLAAAGDDFGHIVTRRPAAVFEPGSVEDVVAIVRLARERGIHVVARGQGHSTYGQSQVEGGIVVDMTSLAGIGPLTGDSVFVGAGIRWLDLVRYTVPRGLVPPTLTGYLGLSVGGTLSVGGIGAETFRSGTQADNVLELEVVTGTGELVRCSPRENAELFDACRCGLGQFGIITGARVRLVAAPPRVRSYTVAYRSAEALLADQTLLAASNRFEHVSGVMTPRDDGGWTCLLDVVEYLAGDAPVEASERLAGLSFEPGTLVVEDRPFFELAERTEAYAQSVRQAGLWSLPHPWFDVFLPASETASFTEWVLSQLTPSDLGHGLLLFFPLRRARCRAPFFRLPVEDDVFLFDWLANAQPPERAPALVEKNRLLYQEAVKRGGTLYPIGALPMVRADWERHFGESWARFEAAKQRFDPDRVLAPGRVFG